MTYKHIEYAIYFAMALFSIYIVASIIFKVCDAIHYRTGAYYRQTKRWKSQLTRKSGTMCEYQTYERLRKLEKEGFKFLFGIYVPKANGGTTEIDIMAIGPKGVLVVENKDYSGQVVGLEWDKYWTQERPYAHYRNEGERRFYNPIMQNDGHIRHLRQFVGSRVPVNSMIVFSDHCDLCVPRLSRNDVRVTQVKKAYQKAREMFDASEANLSMEQVDALYQQMKGYTKVTRSTKKQHIKDCKRASVCG